MSPPLPVEDLEITITSAEPPAVGDNVTLRFGNEPARTGRLSLAALHNALARLQAQMAPAAPDVRVLKEAGEALFTSLLGGHDLYTRAVTLSRQQGHTLRLRINSSQPGVIAVPWEYLHDGVEFLALRGGISLVRGMPLLGREPLPVDGPLRVAVMVSEPADLPPLNSAGETADLAAIEATGIIDLVTVAPTFDALQDALRDHKPHVFHFIGHGSFSERQLRATVAAEARRRGHEEQGQPRSTHEAQRVEEEGDQSQSDERELADARAATLLFTEDEDDEAEGQGRLAFCRADGTAELIEADRLVPLLAGADELRLVLLNACEGAVTGAAAPFAGLAQRLIQQQVPAVIAMQAPIWDRHAVLFSREFYETLAAGQGVEQAVSAGRMSIHGSAGSWGIPTFYLQARAPFALTPLSRTQRAHHLWQKSLTVEARRRRQLLAAALALDDNHAGARAGMIKIENEEEAERLYAAALAYYEDEQWRDAYRALSQVRERVANYRETRRLLAEVLGQLPGPPHVTAHDLAQVEHYRPILNALLDGKLTIFLGDEVGRVGQPAQDRWVEELYPPSATDAAGALARYLPPELQGGDSLLQISQYTLLLDGEDALYERLGDLYGGDYTPTVLHRLLAELPRRLAAKPNSRFAQRRYVLLSTALDDLLERAFDAENQPYHLFAYRPRYADEDGVNHYECFLHYLPRTDERAAAADEPIEVLDPSDYDAHDGDDYPVIVKLCGRHAAPTPASVAVTEDHFVNYIAAERAQATLPASLLSAIRPNRFLFFGHSLRPWHLRLLWQRLGLPRGRRQPKWAIVPALDTIEEKFWRDQDIEPIVARPEGVVAYVNSWLDTL